MANSPTNPVALVLLSAVICGIASTAAAQSHSSFEHYSNKAEGWYWYKDPRPVPEKIQEEPPPPPAIVGTPPPAKDDKAIRPEDIPFSAAWIRANEGRLRDEALDDPNDKDKVRAYMYVQRIILDKAQNFGNAASTIGRTDPLLDETNRFPIDTAAQMAVFGDFSQAKKDALADLSGRGGIFFFFDSRCKHCVTQQRAIRFLQDEHKFQVLNISVDGTGLPGMRDWVPDSGQVAKTLGLTVFPATVFVMPPTGYYIISQGVNSAEALKEKILLAAKDQKLLSADLEKRLSIFDRGVMSADDMNSPELAAAIKNTKDSKTWVDLVRRKLGTKY